MDRSSAQAIDPSPSGREAGGGPALLDIRKVSKTYPARDGKPVRAIDEVSCSIRSGEFASILGPSGCGKSTLLLMIAGLISPTSGTLTFRGDETVSGASEYGIVFQDPVLFPWRDVQTNVELPAEIAGVRKGAAGRDGA